MISVPTADGVAEAIVAMPPDGRGPGVLYYMDAFGLRPRIQDMAEEIAGWGYVVLAPNVFYREGTVADLAPAEDLSTPEGMSGFFRVAGSRIGRLTPERAASDSDAYLAGLRSLPGVTPGPVGVVGFCMGARLAVRTAGRHPEAVAACAGFHGGGLATDAPDSPHLDLAGARAEFLFGHADHDRSMTPDDVARLGAALDEAVLTARNEVYEDAPHGYTMSDTPAWNEAAFVRAFANLRELLARTLG
ncbi:MAG: dienelactone hydrolase family protein [Actinobacteria bacterium]|nr:dienelactone hydrolase family protein [Actinomycetota bacterium]